MRSTVRQISVILLLAVLLAPGLLQARTPARHSAHTTQSAQTAQTPGFFSMVWNLLTTGLLKSGTTLDPSGGTVSGGGSGNTSSSSGTGDAGTVLDPSGTT
jgi:hypothetical protein